MSGRAAFHFGYDTPDASFRRYLQAACSSFVADDTERRHYRKALQDCQGWAQQCGDWSAVAIHVGVHGLANQRVSFSRSFPENARIVSLDDDIDNLTSHYTHPVWLTIIPCVLFPLILPCFWLSLPSNEPPQHPGGKAMSYNVSILNNNLRRHIFRHNNRYTSLLPPSLPMPARQLERGAAIK